MRFVHLSDLHLGKRVNDFSMIEDQRFILDSILGIIKEKRPDAVIIAGDVYDKPVPPAEAVTLFDDFMNSLADIGLELFVISGNHDSAERLSFGSRIMDRQGIHFAGRYDGAAVKYSLKDEYGNVNLYLLPFIKPVHVRQAFAEEDDVPEINTYTDAVGYAIKRMPVNNSERNVLVAHQFCTDALRTESEDISVGGLDNVDREVFEAFDYTALGHLHRPQSLSNSRIRYCGSPIKYSFSETDHDKCLTLVELGEKKDGLCNVTIDTVKLTPLRDMSVLKGPFDELTDKSYYKKIKTDDYMRIILTDENDVIGALSSLRAIYPNIMRLEYDNTRSRAAAIMPDPSDNDSRSPLEIFSGLYKDQNGKEMSEEQTDLISRLIEKVWTEG